MEIIILEITTAAIVSIFLIIKLVQSIIKGKFSFSLGKFDLGVFLIALVYLLAAIFKTPNKMEAFFFPGIATVAILSASFYFFLNQFNTKVKRIFFYISSLAILVGAFFVGRDLLAHSIILPSFETSWDVTIETLKVSPLFGAGPGNYLTAFNLYRPIAYNEVSYNGTNLWQVRFSNANNFYFTMLTETGFAGLFAIAVLLISVYRVTIAEIKEKHWEVGALGLLIVFLAFYPASPLLLFLLMAILAVFSKSEDKSVTFDTGRVSMIVIAVPILAVIVVLGFFATKATRAEITYNKAITALGKDDAKNTYDLLVLATNENPYVDRYHASLAQVDMALAISLASGKNLTDADKSNVTQFVEQAINEGKAEVALNPGRSGNWEILGQIYQKLVTYAQGSDQFAIQAFSQAVALDPGNPNTRIELGEIYLTTGDYKDAIDTFKLAIAVKPDLANAHYNLALAYQGNKDYTDAVSEINNVISLVAKGSDDYNLAETTLTNLQKNINTSK